MRVRFNEAEARTPRIPSQRSPRALMMRFNEAEARTPRMSRADRDESRLATLQ